MRFVILGAGALGTIIAAHLVRAGHDVTVLARGKRAAQLRERGLEVTGLSEFAAPCTVETDPAAVQAGDALVLTAKTYDNADAARSLAHTSFDAVFSVANGVLKNAELAGVFGRERILGCMADTSGELLDSGAARFTRNIMLHLGAPGGGTGEIAHTVARAINDSGVNAGIAANIDTVEWSKFVGWTALFALSVITRFKTAKFLAEPHCARVAASMIREMSRIAAAKHIEIVDQSPLPVATVACAPFDEAVDTLLDVGREWLRTAPDHRMSSLQDLERGKRLEVDETLGYAVAEARALGLDTPSLATCYGLVAGINAERIPA